MFGFGTDKQVVSLDWDGRRLRMAHWRVKRGMARVLRVVGAPIPSDVAIDRPDQMGGFIKRVLAHEGIKSRGAVIDVPRGQVVLNTLSLPAVNVGDLAGMVQLQVAKELPFSLSEAVVDFAVRGDGTADGHSDVLVAAIRRDVLKFYQQVCSAAGLTLERLGLRPFSNMVAVLDMLGNEGYGRVLYADVGPQQTEIGIIKDGTLVFSRAGSVPLDEEHDELPGIRVVDNSAPEERLINKLAVEVNRTAVDYRRTDPGASFDAVVVSGTSGLEARLADQLQDAFNVAGRVYDPTPVLGEITTDEDPPSAWVAIIGLGLAHVTEGRQHLDFVHPKKPVDAAAKRRQKLPWVGAAMIFLGIGGAATYALVYKPLAEDRTELDKEIKVLKEEVELKTQGTKVVSAITAWQDQHPVWPDELLVLMDHLPNDREAAHLKDMQFAATQGEVAFDMFAVNEDVIKNMADDLDTVARADGKKMFNVTRGNITPNMEKDTIYKWKSAITVQSARIAELKNKRDKRRG